MITVDRVYIPADAEHQWVIQLRRIDSDEPRAFAPADLRHLWHALGAALAAQEAGRPEEVAP